MPCPEWRVGAVVSRKNEADILSFAAAGVRTCTLPSNPVFAAPRGFRC